MFSTHQHDAVHASWRAIRFAILLLVGWVHVAAASEPPTNRWILLRDRDDVFRVPVLPDWTVLPPREVGQGQGVGVEFGRTAEETRNTGATLFRFSRDGQYRTPAQWMALLATGHGCQWLAAVGRVNMRGDDPVVFVFACNGSYSSQQSRSFVWLWHAMLGSERDSLASFAVAVDLPPRIRTRDAVLGWEGFLRALELVKLFGPCGASTQIGQCPEAIATVPVP